MANADKKKDILLQSFNVLKDNYINNKHKIWSIFKKVFPIDSDVAVEMWVYLLRNNPSLIKDENEAYGLTEMIINEAEEGIGRATIHDIVVKNGFIKQIVFGDSGDVSYNCQFIVSGLIISNKLVEANELINLVYKNRNNRGHSFDEFLEGIADLIGDENGISEDAVSLILSWTEKITDRERLAKINVALVDII